MYDRFTDRARKVMQLANQEAQRFNHEYIGTEHILLGLVKEGTGCASSVLKNLNIDLRNIRLQVEKIIQPGPDMVTLGKLPQTPRAKKVIEYSIEEARQLNHDYVGTEHLMLGLIREGEGIGAQVLMNLGAKLDDVRKGVLELLMAAPPREAKKLPSLLENFIASSQGDLREAGASASLPEYYAGQIRRVHKSPRDHFAILVLQAWIIKNGFPTQPDVLQNVTDEAYRAADAMMRSRKKKRPD